ncbi:MAG: MarR family transcriptional regulator [Bacteroidetes bacterium]|nr:MAG: MarR family transcriptional regulator [Bacteroidota bacterium]
MANTFPFSETPHLNLEYQLARLAWAFRHHREHMRKHYKVSPQELELIEFIVHRGPGKMREVADHFQMKLSTLTSVVNKAEQRKLLRRKPSPDDGRVVLLGITPQGKKVYDAHTALLREAIRRIAGELDPATFERFLAGIETFNHLSLAEEEKEG